MKNKWRTADIKIFKDSAGVFDAEHKYAGYLYEALFFETRAEARRFAVEVLREIESNLEEKKAQKKAQNEECEFLNIVEQEGNAKLVKNGSWFVMTCGNQKHEIWEPTSAQLYAHWKGFLKNNGIS